MPMTPRQAIILDYIIKNPTTTKTSIALSLHMCYISVTKCIEGLQKSGHVERVNDTVFTRVHRFNSLVKEVPTHEITTHKNAMIKHAVVPGSRVFLMDKMDRRTGGDYIGSRGLLFNGNDPIVFF